VTRGEATSAEHAARERLGDAALVFADEFRTYRLARHELEQLAHAALEYADVVDEHKGGI